MFACRLLCSCDSDRNQLSEVVKPGDFEDKLKMRDDAFNKAIKTVPTEVQVKNEPVGFAQKLAKAFLIISLPTISLFACKNPNSSLNNTKC